MTKSYLTQSPVSRTDDGRENNLLKSSGIVTMIPNVLYRFWKQISDRTKKIINRLIYGFKFSNKSF